MTYNYTVLRKGKLNVNKYQVLQAYRRVSSWELLFHQSVFNVSPLSCQSLETGSRLLADFSLCFINGREHLL